MFPSQGQRAQVRAVRQGRSPVELVQQFHQGTLDLAVCRGTLGETPTTDGVNLVDELRRRDESAPLLDTRRSATERTTRHGSCSFAYANISRTTLADSPMYLSTMADATTLRKLVESVAATARARSVLPVPGGPYRRTPLGGLIPTRANSSGFMRGSSMTCVGRVKPGQMADFRYHHHSRHIPLAVPGSGRSILRSRQSWRRSDPPSSCCTRAGRPHAAESCKPSVSSVLSVADHEQRKRMQRTA